ncbi:MAG: DUF1573 domain-containing protein [candidate division Zixibacteria bacterium]
MRITGFFLLVIIAAIMAPSVSSAQQPSEYTTPIVVDPTSMARIEFLERFWDFGRVPRGHIVYHNFAFRNIGSDTLIITKVKPTCGCTAAPLSTDRIAPGDTAKISVTLDTSKLRGKVRKFVNIDCNDPVNPYYKITFAAEIDSLNKDLVVEPFIADFGEFASGSGPKITLEIKNGSSSSLTLAIADKPSEDIMTATFSDTNIPVDGTAKLTLEIITKVEVGPFSSTIALEAEGSPGTRVSIPVTGKVIE